MGYHTKTKYCIRMIEYPSTPITEETFERQGWEMIVEKEEIDGEVDEYYYWVLSLPKDNPDPNCFKLISSNNDDYKEIELLKEGEYIVEINESYGLGFCYSEEELEILYRALTKSEIED